MNPALLGPPPGAMGLPDMQMGPGDFQQVVLYPDALTTHDQVNKLGNKLANTLGDRGKQAEKNGETEGLFFLSQLNGMSRIVTKVDLRSMSEGGVSIVPNQQQQLQQGPKATRGSTSTTSSSSGLC